MSNHLISNNLAVPEIRASEPGRLTALTIAVWQHGFEEAPKAEE
jgi:hypothetical protein